MGKNNRLYVILILVLALLFAGCSNQKDVESSINEENVKNEDVKSKQITIEDIVQNHIPKILNGKVKENKIEFAGKWPGNVMPDLISALKAQGWEKVEQLGSRMFFVKEIDGQQIKISVTPSEKGGPKEKDAVTIVNFDLCE
ncbi:type II toxin-antitoxin system HicA family toxin [Caloranaerobacter sp. DY30410]|uniref:type II toxin-antitoxin system HicA family toxin n=1 Tax=Caloranaerobacter sp. DY30410 TaxID=3238305 RepID=UPI003CFF8397